MTIISISKVYWKQ